MTPLQLRLKKLKDGTTPGPWYVQDGDLRGDYGLVIGHYRYVKVNYGDAALIASAPALLTLCETLIGALERVKGMCDVGPTCSCGRPNGLPAVISCANTALAKAEQLFIEKEERV